MKKVLKIMGIIILAIIILVLILLVIASERQFVPKNYSDKVETGGNIIYKVAVIYLQQTKKQEKHL